MQSALITGDETDSLSGAGRAPTEGTRMRDEECLRSAAFRLRETADRMAILALRAQDPALRDSLLAIREELLKHQRRLTQTR